MNPTTDLAARFEAKREECEAMARKLAGGSGPEEAYWQCRAAVFADARDMARAGAAGGAGERVRHVKRGTEYEVLGEAELQVALDRLLPNGREWAKALIEGDRIVFYRGDDGKLWAREVSEFRDGRFETIAAAPPPPAQQGSSSSVVGSKAIAREGKVDLPPLKPDQVEYLRDLQASLRPETQIDSETLIGPAGPAIGLDGYNQQGSSSPPLTAERVDLELLRKAAFEEWFSSPDRDAFNEGQAAAGFKAGWNASLTSVPASLPGGTGTAEEGTDLGATPMGSGSRPSDRTPAGSAGYAVSILRAQLMAKAEEQIRYWRERQSHETCPEEQLDEDGNYTPVGDDAASRFGYCNGRFSEADWWLKTLQYLDLSALANARPSLGEIEQLRKALADIENGTVLVFDESEEREVETWMDAEDMQEIARQALAEPAQGTEAEGRNTEGGSVHEGPVVEGDVPKPDPVGEAKALLEGLSPIRSAEEWVNWYRKRADHCPDLLGKASCIDHADAIEAALVTLHASQDQAGEVRA